MFFVLIFSAFFGKIVLMEKKSHYECVSNEIWSKVAIVNESGDHGIMGDTSTFIKFDQFRRFWFIIGGKREVCDF